MASEQVVIVVSECGDEAVVGTIATWSGHRDCRNHRIGIRKLSLTGQIPSLRLLDLSFQALDTDTPR